MLFSFHSIFRELFFRSRASIQVCECNMCVTNISSSLARPRWKRAQKPTGRHLKKNASKLLPSVRHQNELTGCWQKLPFSHTREVQSHRLFSLAHLEFEKNATGAWKPSLLWFVVLMIPILKLLGNIFNESLWTFYARLMPCDLHMAHCAASTFACRNKCTDIRTSEHFPARFFSPTAKCGTGRLIRYLCLFSLHSVGHNYVMRLCVCGCYHCKLHMYMPLIGAWLKLIRTRLRRAIFWDRNIVSNNSHCWHVMFRIFGKWSTRILEKERSW